MKHFLFVLVVSLIAVSLLMTGYSKPAMAASPASTAVQPKSIEWRVQTMFQAGGEDFNLFAKDPRGFVSRVKESSGGRLTIKPFAPGELVPLLDSFQAVSGGMIEGSVTNPGYWAGKIPAAAFAANLPYSLSGTDVNVFFDQQGAKDILRDIYARFNIRLIDISYNGDFHIWSKKPVYTLKDFKGLKIRILGLAQDVLTKLGASTVMLPGPDTYMALERGVIEAATWGPIPAAVTSARLHEVTNYILMPPYTGMGAHEIIINKKAFEALPNDLKAIVEHAGMCFSRSFANFNIDRGNKILRELVDKGKIKVAHMQPEEAAKLREVAISAIERAARDDDSAKMLKALKDYIKLTEATRH